MELAQLQSQVHICQNASCGHKFTEPITAREPETPNPKCIFCGSNTKKLYSKPILTVYGKALPTSWE